MTRTLDLFPADKRVVFSKYIPDHIQRLSKIVSEHKELPFEEVVDISFAEMKKQEIALTVDCRMMIFDIWHDLKG